MNSVTSNAVAKSLSYSTTEVNTGIKWTDGNDIYKKTYIYREKSITGGSAVVLGTKSGFSNNNVIDIEHNIRFTLYGENTIVVRGDFEVYLLGDNISINTSWTTATINADINLTFYYTKPA